MRLDRSTWQEVEGYLSRSTGILIPTGSTEQHGPVGAIGTDAICATAVAEAAAERADALVAPTLAYAPAPFNSRFPGTVSISGELFQALFLEIAQALTAQGFRRLYVVNGHGANTAALEAAFATLKAELGTGAPILRLRAWWQGDAVQALRRELYGAWEGLHATPSEVAITQALGFSRPESLAPDPPEALSAEEIARRAGDRHESAEEHRARFPDGRVGSHSTLARPDHGRELLAAAAQEIADDYLCFLAEPG